jgi:hypothetical protein
MKQAAKHSRVPMWKYGTLQLKYDKQTVKNNNTISPQGLLRIIFTVKKKMKDPTKRDFKNQYAPNNCSCPSIFVMMDTA